MGETWFRTGAFIMVGTKAPPVDSGQSGIAKFAETATGALPILIFVLTSRFFGLALPREDDNNFPSVSL